MKVISLKEEKVESVTKNTVFQGGEKKLIETHGHQAIFWLIFFYLWLNVKDKERIPLSSEWYKEGKVGWLQKFQ